MQLKLPDLTAIAVGREPVLVLQKAKQFAYINHRRASGSRAARLPLISARSAVCWPLPTGCSFRQATDEIVNFDRHRAKAPFRCSVPGRASRRTWRQSPSSSSRLTARCHPAGAWPSRGRGSPGLSRGTVPRVWPRYRSSTAIRSASNRSSGPPLPTHSKRTAPLGPFCFLASAATLSSLLSAAISHVLWQLSARSGSRRSP